MEAFGDALPLPFSLLPWDNFVRWFRSIGWQLRSCSPSSFDGMTDCFVTVVSPFFGMLLGMFPLSCFPPSLRVL